MRQIVNLTSFPTLQVLADLRSVAAKGFSELSTRLKPEKKQALRRVVFDQRGRMSEADAGELAADILLIAALPDNGFDAFLTATALLLADRLQDGASNEDLAWNWDTFQNRYREAPAATRAALMNGFRFAHAARKVALAAPPSGGDLHTFDEDDLLRLLRQIARSMTGEIRDAVCGLAGDGTADVHRRALENCLGSNCILSEFGNWFPVVVVEKASLIKDHPGFVGCLALILVNAIVTQDTGGRMAHRWEEMGEEFERLPAHVRATMIAGVRHLHEMSFDWKPYAAWSTVQVAEKAIVVPFAKA